MPGYSRDLLDFGITLHRMWVNYPDEIGARDQWNSLMFQHYNRMPFRTLWDGLDIWIWDMRHPDLVTKTNQGHQCLLDYNPSEAGRQVAAGLYFNKDRLEIGVFPNGWDSLNPSTGNVGPDSVSRAMDVISHEIGHFYADIINYPAKAVEPQICKDIGYSFNLLRPYQSSNADEDIAECYRALFGGDNCIGKFSDGKTAVFDPRLITLLRTAYWLSASLANTEYINFRIDASHVYWDKLEWVLKTNWFLWSYWEKSVTGNFRLNHRWQTEKLISGTWTSV